MDSSSVIFVWILCIAIYSGGSHCDTITFQPGLSYSWIIPPRRQPVLVDAPPPVAGPFARFESRNESPLTPIGGYGHPQFYRRHSHEQLSLPNEFLITSGDPQRVGGGRNDGRVLSPIMPLFQQLDPVDCDGDPTCSNVDITQQQQRPTTMHHQSNIASVPAITPPDYQHPQQRISPPSAHASPGQHAVSWPSSHDGGIGLLFFVTESASHLPVEQLIRQQLALHRTQFPFDISINCEDAVGSGCRPGGILSLQPPPPLPLPLAPATTVNGRNAENGNYASPPLVEIDNDSSRRGSQEQRKWRTIGERLVRNKHQQQNRLQQQQQFQQLQQQQEQFQLQQNQRELSILP